MHDLAVDLLDQRSLFIRIFSITNISVKQKIYRPIGMFLHLSKEWEIVGIIILKKLLV